MKMFSLTIVLASHVLAGVCLAQEVRQAEAKASAGSFTVMIREQAGIERRAEPTQVSLPFATGALKKPDAVAITDASGNSLAAQVEVLARWHDDSIRWLLARFLADVPANGKLTLMVRRGDGSSMVQGEEILREERRNLVADTGLIHVEVGPDRRDGFWVTDHEGNALLKQRPQLVVYSPTGEEFRSGPPDQVEREVNGPLYASIFLTGPMKAKDAQYDNILRWETRLHFWNGLARVLAEHTVVAMGAAKDGVTIIDGIVVELKSVDRFCKYVVSGNDTNHAGDLAAGDTVRQKQACAYWHECTRGPDQEVEPVRYVVLEEDFGYELKANKSHLLARGEKAAGWLWAAGGRRSLGVAVRDYWEEGPKALRVAADGTVGIECYAHWQPEPGEPRPARQRTPDFSKHGRLDAWAKAIGEDPEAGMKLWIQDTQYAGPVRRGPYRFGEGRAKTTDVLYLFGQSGNQEAEIDALAARRDVLIPVVDPRYLASTRALPFVWSAARDSGLPVYEKGLRQMFENWKQHATRYGFLHFGDDQCGWGYNRTVPSTTDDQEYDTAQCLTMQFGRTGDPDYLRRANTCARHFIDVDQVHPTGELHFHGYTAGGDYHEEKTGVDMGGHPYIGGIVNHYMLTGDRRSLRGLNRVAEALRGYGGGGRNWLLSTDERTVARGGICLAAIYDLTRNPAHLAPVKKMVDVINDLAGDVTQDLKGEAPFHIWWINHNEMCYHLRELLVRYHAASGEPRALATLRKALDLYIGELWDSQKIAWRGMFGAPFDFNMQYEHAVPREPSRGTSTEIGTAELGMPFAYLAGVTGDEFYLTPLLESLDNMGRDFAKRYGSRQFGRRQLWSLPLVSMLPDHWRADRDRIVQREVFRASLKEGDRLFAWTPDGQVQGTVHGEARWADSPFGKVLQTYRNTYVTFPAPKDILKLPGTVSFWVRRDQTKWDRKPWPWYGALRGLLYIGLDARETNALDLMMLKNDLWTRLYDDRAWEMAAMKSASPAWREGQWHHIAVVWNRYDLTVFINGEQVGHDDRFALPNGGQTAIHLGWRPTNRYGQADYHDLRIFRAALPPRRIKRIYDSTRLALDEP